MAKSKTVRKNKTATEVKKCGCGEEYFGPETDKCYACLVGRKHDGTPWPPSSHGPKVGINVASVFVLSHPDHAYPSYTFKPDPSRDKVTLLHHTPGGICTYEMTKEEGREQWRRLRDKGYTRF